MTTLSLALTRVALVVADPGGPKGPNGPGGGNGGGSVQIDLSA